MIHGNVNMKELAQELNFILCPKQVSKKKTPHYTICGTKHKTKEKKEKQTDKNTLKNI